MSAALARGRSARIVEQRAVEMRGISRCWQNSGFHVYGAGPCFDTIDQAKRYRSAYDGCETNLDWWSFRRRWENG